MASLQNTTESIPKPRVPFTSKVWITASDEASDRRPTLAVNLSETGIFLQTSDPLTPGTRFGLEFKLNPKGPTIATQAEVVWIKKFEAVSIDGLLPGMGVHFTAISEGSRKAIRHFVEAPESVRNQQLKQAQKAYELSRDTSRFAFDRPMILQVSDDRRPILGKAVNLGRHGMAFQAEGLSETMQARLERLASECKGFAALPIKVEWIRKFTGPDGNPTSVVGLRFLDLKPDLFKQLPEISARFTSPYASTLRHPNEAASSTETDELWRVVRPLHANSHWLDRFVKPLIAATLGVALAGALFYQFFLHQFQAVFGPTSTEVVQTETVAAVTAVPRTDALEEEVVAKASQIPLQISSVAFDSNKSADTFTFSFSKAPTNYRYFGKTNPKQLVLEIADAKIEKAMSRQLSRASYASNLELLQTENTAKAIISIKGSQMPAISISKDRTELTLELSRSSL